MFCIESVHSHQKSCYINVFVFLMKHQLFHILRLETRTQNTFIKKAGKGSKRPDMHCIVFVASLRPQWCLLQLQWRRQDLHFTEDKFNNGIFHLAHSCQRKMPSHGRLTKLKRNKTSALNTREVKDSPLIYMQ